MKSGSELNSDSDISISTSGSDASTINFTTSGTNNGTISAAGTYTQDNEDTKVYTNILNAGNEISIVNGTLNTNYIGSDDGSVKAGSYSQTGGNATINEIAYISNGANISGGETNIIKKLYAKNISISDGTTNVGKGQSSSTLSATDTISLTGGTINLNNTTLEASATGVPGSDAVNIDTTVNYSGTNNYIGKYGTNSYIHDVNIGDNANIVIGNGSSATTLNIDAGAGGITSTGTIDNKYNNSTLNLTAVNGDIDFTSGTLSNKGSIFIKNGSKTVKLGNVNDSGSIIGSVSSGSATEIKGEVYTNSYEQTAGTLKITDGTDNKIVADTISFDNTSGLTVNANQGLTLQIKDSPTTGKITFKNGSTTTVNGTLTTDSSNGSVDFNSGSTVSNSGIMNINGSGTTTFNTKINTSGTKNGTINKKDSGTLTFNDEVYGNIFDSSEGKVYFNENSAFSNTVNIDNTTAEIAANKSLSANGNVTLGSVDNWATTTITLKSGSSIETAAELYINATLNAYNATLKGKNVYIADTSTLNIYGPSGADTVINANNGSGMIKISDATVNVKEGAILKFIGNVDSTTSHYSIDTTEWISSGGTYSNTDYNGADVGGSIVYNSTNGFVTLDSSSYNFQNSNTSNNGGAIYNDGTVRYSSNTPSSSTAYTNNKAGYDSEGVIQNTNALGGAIYNTKNYELGYNTTFDGNIASKDGGAVYNNGGTIKSYYNDATEAYAHNTTFKNNKAGYNTDNVMQNANASGGAVYNKNGNILLGNTVKFENNEASYYGGAIYNDANGKEITIGEKSSFSENIARIRGGAIYNEAGTVSISKDASFTGNKAGYHLGEVVSSSGLGGAVYVNQNSTVKFSDNTKFTDNVATKDGGAIYNDGKIQLTYDSTKTSPVQSGYYGTTFTGNGKNGEDTVTANGGAIYLTANGTVDTITLDGTTNHSGIYRASFDNNSSTTSGGAIYNGNTTTTLNIFESSLTNNSSKDGGAIFNKGTVTVDSSILTGNNATNYGGVIYNDATSTANINAGTQIGAIDGGNSAKAGGAIYNTGVLNNLGTDEDNIVSYIGNQATSMGGAIYNNNTLNTSYTIFDSNIAGKAEENIQGQGGAIYNDGAAITLNSGTVFNNNSAIGTIASSNKFAKGGAIANTGTVTINEVQFTKNNTDGYGGAVFNAGTGTVNINAGTVIGGNMNDENPSESGNTALKGGGIYNDGTLNINGTTTNNVYFVGNTASSNGGAIYNASATATSIDNTYFYANKTNSETSKGYGGAVYNDAASNMNILANTKFDSNEADYGAAVYNAGTMTIENGTGFIKNKGANSIGNEGSLTLGTGFTFGNTVENANSGALYNDKTGTIYLTTDPSTDYSLVVFNTGDGTIDGAGIHSTGDSVISTDNVANKLDNAIFFENKGKDGGAIYNDSTEIMNISTSLFYDNTAAGSGGAIYNKNQDGKSSYIYIDNDVEFRNNAAEVKGGAIYNTGDNATVEFAANYTMGVESHGYYHNSAREAGGAIANEGALVLNAADANSISINMYHQGGLHADNVYTDKGGALYLSGANSSVTTKFADTTPDFDGLANAKFSNNEANNGAAIYNDNTSLNIKSTTFTNNKAQKAGGAIYNNGADSDLNILISAENTFMQNSAGTDSTTGTGGAIYNNGGDLLITTDSASEIKGFYRNSAGTGGAIYNGEGLVSIDGNIAFENNSAQYGGAIAIAQTDTATEKAVVDLNLTNGDIVFKNNVTTDGDASGSAIYFGGKGGQLIIRSDNPNNKLTFSDSSEGNIAQTLASADDTINLIDIRGGIVNFESDASNYRGAYKQSGGTVNVSNNFLNIDKEQSDFTGVRGGEIIFNEGAKLSSNDLIVTNAEDPYNGSAKVIFNENSVSKLTDLGALYQATAAKTFTYGDNTIDLSVADVVINDTATIANASEIGYSKSVRNLEIGNDVTIAAPIKVDGDTNPAYNTITLALNDGVKTTSNANISLNNYSKLDIKNSTDEITMNGSISSNSTNASIIKSNAGNLTFENGSNELNFKGTYTQNDGTVEFKDGSSFFGNGASNTVNGGNLVFTDNVTFKNDNSTVVTMNNDTGFKTNMDTTVKLTPDGSDDYVVVTDESASTSRINLAGTDIELDINGESTIDATTGPIFIGNGEKLRNLDVDSTTGSAITIDVNADDPRFVLHNDDNTDGVGVLTLGDNVTITGSTKPLSIEMKDNTNLIFNNATDTTFDTKISTISAYDTVPPYTTPSTIETNWAAARGNIVKDSAGTVTINGNVDDFHGTLVYKNGSIALSDTTNNFADNVEYDLSQISDNAVVTVNHITDNDDIVLTGDIAKTSTSSYILSVNNEVGGITKDTATGVSNVFVKNSSIADINVAGDVNLDNMTVSTSTANIKSGGNVNFADIDVNTNSIAVINADGTVDMADVNVNTNSKATISSVGDINIDDLDVNTNSTAYIKTKGTIGFNSASVTNSSYAALQAPTTNVFNDFILRNSTLEIKTGNLNIGGNFTMGSTVNMMGRSINNQNIAGNMTLAGDSNYLIDINPATYTSDRVVVGGAMASDTPGTVRTLKVSDYNLMSDSPSEVTTYSVFSVNNNDITDVSFAATNKIKSTNIADYRLVSAGSGKYNLIRTNFNPNVMATSVASQGAFLTQIESYDTALANLDMTMQLPILGARENKNVYAMADIDETIVYSPTFIPELQKGIWFRPYGHFEKDKYQDGPNTDAQLYGFLVGFDSPLKELKGDFLGNLSGYVGYNGLHQSYSGVSNYQNGGMIGVSGALYKGGFFSGLTANINLGMNNTSTANRGSNNFFMMSTGIASKTGYNWELARGRFIIQPSWLMSYTLVNAFNSKDSSGVKIDTKALQAVQLAPGLKFIGNLPHGWQPYLMVNFRWNLGDKAKYKVGQIALPETYTKPYIEYGAGVQKRWGDRFTGFGQFVARNIGRNGIGLNLGLRWSVGK